MRENFSISEILEAVDLLLDQKIKKKSFIEKKKQDITRGH